MRNFFGGLAAREENHIKGGANWSDQEFEMDKGVTGIMIK